MKHFQFFWNLVYRNISHLHSGSIAKNFTYQFTLHITGKSYLAQAFANHAIHHSYKVYYVRMPSLLEEIRLSRIDGTYINVLKKYSRFKLLILDDFGVMPMADDDATNLFVPQGQASRRLLRTEHLSIQQLSLHNCL